MEKIICIFIIIIVIFLLELYEKTRPNRLNGMYKINTPWWDSFQMTIFTHAWRNLEKLALEVCRISYFLHLFILNCMHGFSAAFYSYSVCSEFTDMQVLSYYYSAWQSPSPSFIYFILLSTTCTSLWSTNKFFFNAEEAAFIVWYRLWWVEAC